MLSKKEWSKQRVVKWEGVKNCDTHTVERGYLFLREDDGSITGCSTRVSSRAEAIAYHYGLYAENATQQSVQRTAFQPEHNHVFIGGVCHCGEKCY